MRRRHTRQPRTLLLTRVYTACALSGADFLTVLAANEERDRLNIGIVAIVEGIVGEDKELRNEYLWLLRLMI